MAMEFRLLRSFTEVVRCGGFSQAARSLASTQSTISKAVKQLENELGTILLDRSGHRCVMTPAGEVVYRRGIKLLADRDDVLAELDEIRGLQRGVLRLGIPSVGNIKLFAPVVCTYRERYPQIELRLIEHGSNQLEKHLRAGDIDIAGILEPQSPDFEWEPIRSKPIVALLSSVHPLSRCGSLKLTDLRDVPFVLFDLGFRLHGMILNASRKAGFEPTVAVTSSQIDFMIELVSTNVGVAFLSSEIVDEKHLQGIVSVPLDEAELAWVMGHAWRRNAYLSDATVAWMKLMRETSRPSELYTGV